MAQDIARPGPNGLEAAKKHERRAVDVNPTVIVRAHAASVARRAGRGRTGRLTSAARLFMIATGRVSGRQVLQTSANSENQGHWGQARWPSQANQGPLHVVTGSQGV